MKKIMALILALVLCLSLCACGGNDDTSTAAKAPSKASELKAGDTAIGQLFDVTVKSVEVVDKIENGYVWHMWSPAEKTTYQDVTAEEGYAIIKITYSYTYKGKASGEFGFELLLDYDDGYTFDGLGGHAIPAIDFSKSKVGYEEKYEVGAWDCFCTISDPLNFTGAEVVEYIIVNDQVLSNTDKAFVLKLDVPTSPWDYKANEWGILSLMAVTDPETFTFNLR